MSIKNNHIHTINFIAGEGSIVQIILPNLESIIGEVKQSGEGCVVLAKPVVQKFMVTGNVAKQLIPITYGNIVLHPEHILQIEPADNACIEIYKSIT